MSQQQDNKDEVTVAEAIALTGFSRSTLYNRIEKGELAPLPKEAGLKRRRVTKFLRADVLKLLED